MYLCGEGGAGNALRTEAHIMSQNHRLPRTAYRRCSQQRTYYILSFPNVVIGNPATFSISYSYHVTARSEATRQSMKCPAGGNCPTGCGSALSGHSTHDLTIHGLRNFCILLSFSIFVDIHNKESFLKSRFAFKKLP